MTCIACGKGPLTAGVAPAGTVPDSRTVTAGTGLTGGGDLSADRTIDAAANADGSIVVNADDIQVGILASDAQHGSHSGGLHSLATPGTPGEMSAADKTKLDTLVSPGFVDPKQSVRAATLIAGTLASDFDDGKTIDGVVLATGDRILIKNQASGAENGIYDVVASGAPSRASDMPAASEAAGNSTFIEEGSQADTGWVCTTDGPTDIVGTDPLAFAQFTSGVTSVFTRTGAVVAVDADYSGAQVVFSPDGDIAATRVQAAIVEVRDDTDTKLGNKADSATTITAGTGLTGGGDLSANRTLNVAANADASIVVNANDIQVGVLATDAQHGTRGGGTQHATATDAATGFVELATQAEVDAGSDAVRAVTPATLAAATTVTRDTTQGAISVFNGSTATTGVNSSTQTVVLGFDTDREESGDGVTADQANNRLIITRAGLYLIGVSASFEGTANEDFVIEAFMTPDNTGTPGGTDIGFHRTNGSGGDVGSAARNGLAVRFSALAVGGSGAFVDARVMSGAGSGDSITMVDGALTAMRVAD